MNKRLIAKSMIALPLAANAPPPQAKASHGCLA